jgi:hypothetical protein
LQAVEQNAESNIVAAPKITLFNGQHAQILGLVKSTLQYEATRSADHQFVFLKVASDADTQLDESVSETIGSGGSLLLRIDESNVVAWNPEPATGSGFLYLQKIPYLIWQTNFIKNITANYYVLMKFTAMQTGIKNSKIFMMLSPD